MARRETADPQTADVQAPGPDGEVQHVRVAVIGSGFGGLGAAVRLRAEGITDFVVLERAASVGGTWRDNSYPGCACDVPSHLYSFSFAPNPDWPRTFSGQPEIRAYLERIADRFRLRDHLRFNHEVLSARWDAAGGSWEVRTSQGRYRADVLVAACGPLSDPSVPDLPGLDGFPGEVFHSARWDHDYQLAGKRVAVVGTGASAIQIIPQIQPQVDRLVVLQRTPPWVMPRMDRDITAVERWVYRRFPATQRALRAALWGLREYQVGAFVKRPGLLRAAEAMAKRNIDQHVADPALRAKLTPRYRFGCKRVLLSNTYYPALSRPNVDVVASGLKEVRGSTVVAADGTEHEVDAIVFSTGFHVTDMPIGSRITGTAGRTLAEEWKDGMAALRGTTVSGFPNLLMVIGPNTGLGNSSMVLMIESQLNYLADFMRSLEAPGLLALDPTAGAQRRWNDDVQRRMARTVWTTGGCQSWYLDANGRNTSLWPGTTAHFRRETRRVDLAEYDRISVAAPAAAEPARA
ncbi:NAD(P)/FAD-dependent oxidoreductase [Streptacidiphilus sp. P02-A3a]|uniref:flavin-containing monooxygenase n=1 Tax=Streptacidiphilus sp. P02-A3a TaxID=2704468 RepID=UPI0015F888E7|nr:NAD(P)/FAD-dependent oxidoreductase [Streptacidiphilus sp. P02-A3a]QMU69290.1 NAD(P)/FAD-dependent oxidoreductase [Streptacidiphilus sp. P02-A3a]